MENFLNSNFFQTLAILGTAIAAYSLGRKQNEINKRSLNLQDYVTVCATPAEGRINLLNTGRVNLYLWGYDLLGDNLRLKKPRLIPVGTGSDAYYWIPFPALAVSQQKMEFLHQFEFKLYVEDEFGKKWTSEHGGEIFQSDQQPVRFKVWSYKTYRENWEF